MQIIRYIFLTGFAGVILGTILRATGFFRGEISKYNKEFPNYNGFKLLNIVGVIRNLRHEGVLFSSYGALFQSLGFYIAFCGVVGFITFAIISELKI